MQKKLITMTAAAVALGGLVTFFCTKSAVPIKQVSKNAIFLNPDASIDERINDLISQMTIEEKAAQLCWSSSGNERLRIPEWAGWNQCLHGVWSKHETTLFPVPIALAATWNDALIHDVANAISDEGRALYNIHAYGPNGLHGLVYRAPVINMTRDPRWGRIQECYGEDPYLTSRIGVAFIKGLQGSDPKYLKVASTIKHFALNNQELNRMSLIVSVPERPLYEYWLPHWRACVQEGKAQSVMAAYNGVNGAPCVINKVLLTEILKQKWGFKGFVVSDLFGLRELMKSHKVTSQPTEAVAMTVQAGCDYDDEEYRDAIPGAVKSGLLKEKDIDAALARVLRVAFKLGVFDPPSAIPYSALGAENITSEAHHKLALESARQSLVLLENKDSFLPLDKAHLKSIAVIGPYANTPIAGSYCGAAVPRTTLLQALKSKLGDAITINYCPGFALRSKTNDVDIEEAKSSAARSDVVLLCLGTDETIETEGIDRQDLALPEKQQRLLEAICSANKNTVLVLSNAGAVSTVWAKQHVPAVLESWYGGDAGGTAIAEAIFGETNPGGKLPYTIYAEAAQLPPQSEYDITKGFTYMYFKHVPLYPFGYGLSYTTFDYSTIRLTTPKVQAGSMLDFKLTIKNAGTRSGDEVVQVYVHQLKARVEQPIKQLVAFRRVHLNAGQSEELHFKIPANQFALYDTQLHDFRLDPGAYQLLVGSSSADLRCQQPFEIAATASLPRSKGTKSPNLNDKAHLK